MYARKVTTQCAAMPYTSVAKIGILERKGAVCFFTFREPPNSFRESCRLPPLKEGWKGVFPQFFGKTYRNGQ